jgi:hypothetical protein
MYIPDVTMTCRSPERVVRGVPDRLSDVLDDNVLWLALTSLWHVTVEQVTSNLMDLLRLCSFSEPAAARPIVVR